MHRNFLFFSFLAVEGYGSTARVNSFCAIFNSPTSISLALFFVTRLRTGMLTYIDMSGKGTAAEGRCQKSVLYSLCCLTDLFSADCFQN